MDGITRKMKITGLVCAIASLLIGCTLSQKMADSRIESQNQKIQQLTKELHKSQQAYLALLKENRKLKAENLRLMETSRKLEKDNRELAMKINMLKILDRRVEEKRKNYTNDQASSDSSQKATGTTAIRRLTKGHRQFVGDVKQLIAIYIGE